MSRTLASTAGMMGKVFHAEETVGVTPGKNVAVGVSVLKTIGVGLGFGVREAAVINI